MNRYILTFLISLLIIQPSQAFEKSNFFNLKIFNNNERAVKKVLTSQVKYANKTNFEKFISTYDAQYYNADGFNLDKFSNLIKDVWNTYNNIEYDIEIKNITINDNKATVEVNETSYANISMTKAYDGELKSEANTIYYLEKKPNGSWKVISDKVIDETTTMLYGDAKELEIKLTAPNQITSNTDYTATLEFTPPKNTIAIASIAADKVEYPQKQTEEIFRPFPEDNILERIFTSNDDNANEYVVASIGLTKTSVNDMNIKLSLTGFGYTIKRVNVISQKEKNGDTNE